MPTLATLIVQTGALINQSIALLASVALVVFLWGLVRFVFKLGSGEGKVEEGRSLMVWGLVSLFVMFSIWGLVAFIQKAFDLPMTATQNAPEAGVTPSRFDFNYLNWLPRTPEAGVLPSSNFNHLLNQPNQPEAGNLPSNDFNYLNYRPSQPEAGNIPEAPNQPAWWQIWR